MSPTLADLIAAEPPLNTAIADAYDALDAELASLAQWSERASVTATEGLMRLVSAYRDLPPREDVENPNRTAALRAFLRNLSPEVQSLVADLLIEHPRRRALTLRDNPYAYLQAQLLDGWVKLRGFGCTALVRDFEIYGHSQTLRELRTSLSEEDAEALAGRVSEIVHAGASVKDPARFFVRVHVHPLPLPEPIIRETWLIIDRVNDGTVTHYPDEATARDRCALINRHPEGGAAFAQAAMLARQIRFEIVRRPSETVLKRAHDWTRGIAQELMAILEELDSVETRI